MTKDQMNKILFDFLENDPGDLETESTQEKVLDALRYSGELPYYKLLLVTGTDSCALNQELKQLIDSKKIKATALGNSSNDFTSPFSSSTFRINRGFI